MPTINEISQILLDYRYFILFPLVVIEGPIVTVLAGSFVYLNKLNLFLAYTVVVAGDLFGDTIYYLIGRYAKKGIIENLVKKLKLSMERLSSLEEHFQENGGKTLLLGKISHGIGSIFLVAAGIAKMRFGRFFWYNFLGTVPKSFLLIIVGYYYGQSITQINSIFERLSILFMTAGIIALIIYFYHPHKK